ncbi:MAG: MmcQ/YjbR family DNA-binding protein [Lachnospiraceae bacterium]|nr:MmcQ/YjbR family DNA-binding protein [Lachnospiraceae bacterium]
MFEDIFKRKKLNVEKLLAYGFETMDKRYTYRRDIMDGNFTLHIFLDENGMPDTSLTDLENGEEYTLYKTNALGAFVGDVRLEIESVLSDISTKCYEPEIFKEEQSKMLISYVREKYGDELEFLWPKSPDNAIWRRKDNKKWYGILLTIQKSKLGLDSQEIVEVIDLRAKPEELESLVDGKLYFPGWHMNKKHWYTMILDGSISYDEVCRRVDKSYELDDKKQ